MSWSQWSCRGYGYPLFGDFEKIKEFVIKHKALVRLSLYNYDDEDEAACNGDEDKLLDLTIRKCNDEYDFEEATDARLTEIVAAIINELEGINIVCGYESCGDTDQAAMIGISPFYPWDLKPGDAITKDKATEILKKYAVELGITEEPDYFEASYCG